jgi:hypothetical protein
MPSATPRMLRPSAELLSSQISAIATLVMPMLALSKPHARRAKNATQNVCERPNHAMATVVPTRPKISSGLRPHRSLRRFIGMDDTN